MRAVVRGFTVDDVRVRSHLLQKSGIDACHFLCDDAVVGRVIGFAVDAGLYVYHITDVVHHSVPQGIV